MTLIIGSALLIILGRFALSKSTCGGPLEMFSVISQVLGVTVLIATLAIAPINRLVINVKIARFNSVQTTVDNARNNPCSLERTAFLLKTAEMNQWLAGVQYLNNSLLDIWIPDSVTELTTIK